MEDSELLQRAWKSAEFFNTYIYPLSYEEELRKCPHTNKWIKDCQENTHVAILSARRHLKSSMIYSYLMWRLLTHPLRDYEVFYFSFQENVASYHTSKLKKLISHNPFFREIRDLTQAESILKYTWDGVHTFTIMPAGMLGFKRGIHPDEVIADDVLADPANELNFTVIDKINRTFFEELMSLPKESGNGLKLVGTAQTDNDLFFQIKNRSNKFNWGMYKAIMDYQTKKVLWPEQYSYDRLLEIRDEEIGTKAFEKEYMCSPVHSENAYFNRLEIDELTNTSLQPCLKLTKTKEQVYLGWDIGKKSHPSHVAVFKAETTEGITHYTQLVSLWMDNEDYTKQLHKVKDLCVNLGVDEGYWDSTRGEFESFYEQGEMPDMLKPMNFTRKAKFDMATVFEKIVNDKRLTFLPDERQTSQIVCVNNDLEAPETPQGHGDSFFSVAMALFAAEKPGLVMGWTTNRERR